jgi:hypothetical protein
MSKSLVGFHSRIGSLYRLGPTVPAANQHKRASSVFLVDIPCKVMVLSLSARVVRCCDAALEARAGSMNFTGVFRSGGGRAQEIRATPREFGCFRRGPFQVEEVTHYSSVALSHCPQQEDEEKR